MKKREKERWLETHLVKGCDVRDVLGRAARFADAAGDREGRHGLVASGVAVEHGRAKSLQAWLLAGGQTLCALRVVQSDVLRVLVGVCGLVLGNHNGGAGDERGEGERELHGGVLGWGGGQGCFGDLVLVEFYNFYGEGLENGDSVVAGLLAMPVEVGVGRRFRLYPPPHLHPSSQTSPFHFALSPRRWHMWELVSLHSSYNHLPPSHTHNPLDH